MSMLSDMFADRVVFKDNCRQTAKCQSNNQNRFADHDNSQYLNMC